MSLKIEERLNRAWEERVAIALQSLARAQKIVEIQDSVIENLVRLASWDRKVLAVSESAVANLWARVVDLLEEIRRKEQEPC